MFMMDKLQLIKILCSFCVGYFLSKNNLRLIYVPQVIIDPLISFKIEELMRKYTIFEKAKKRCRPF